MRPLDPRLLRRSRTVRRYLVAAVLLGGLTAVTVVAQAALLAHLVASGFSASTLPTGPLLALVGCLVGRGVLGHLAATTAARAAVGVRTELRHEVVDSLMDPRRTGPRPPSSRVATLLGPGLGRLDGYIGRFLPQLVLAAVVPGVVVVALLAVDLLTAVIVCLTVPLVIGFLVLVGLSTQDHLDRRWDELARLGRHFSDLASGVLTLRTFGRRSDRGLRVVGERHRRATVRSLRTAFLSALVLELFSTLSMALVAVATGLRIVGGDLDLATGLFVLLLAPEAYLPIRRLGLHYHDSTEGVAAAQEALDLLDRRRSEGTRVPAAQPVVELRDVTVERDGRLLHLPDLRIEPGEVVAVTGPSGSGKSTLLAVLLGLVAPTEGSVMLGGVDAGVDGPGGLDLPRWRARTAWVPQVPAVPAGTIAEAVRLGSPGADDDAVRAALAAAGAAELDPGRVVREGGADLSAGERRRVAVARAVLRCRTRPVDLLLLDEPTAGLDAAREAAVLEVLRDLGPAVVVVAHHRRAIEAADRVVGVRGDLAGLGLVGPGLVGPGLVGLESAAVTT